MTEENNRIDEYWFRLQKAIEQAENLFEQKITYIASGALVLFVGFVENIIPLDEANCKCLVVLSWFLVGGALLVNLTSQLVSKYHIKEVQKDLSKNLSIEEEEDNLKRRNRIIEWWNIVTLLFLALGIILFVIFVSINVL